MNERDRHANAGQAVSALGATDDLLNSDPYFTYSHGSRPAAIAEPPLGAGTVMRVEVVDEHRVRHFDAHATPAAIAADRLPKGAMQIVGDDAIRRFQEFVRVGGELELKGVSMTWEHNPRFLQQLLSDQPGPDDIRLSTPHRVPPQSVTVELETTTGHASIDLQMQATAPPEGWDKALVGRRGGSTVTLTLRHREVAPEMSLRLDWTMKGARSASDQLSGLTLLNAAAGTGELRLLHGRAGEMLARAPSPQTPFDPDMAALMQLLEGIVAIEDWLGRTIDMSPGIRSSDANTVLALVRLLSGVEETWTSMTFALARDPGELAVADGGMVQVRHKLAPELFGQSYELGDEVRYVSDVRVAKSAPLDGGGRSYVLEPGSVGAKMLRRLER